ncbi:hypothetical protein O1L60_35550 [Streptomyces diastatochromogenes]|nr:hypothetical protein [Streptomyces diastatochromogenes]
MRLRRSSPDTVLVPALCGLVGSGASDPWRRTPDVALPATLTALAADGACLAGTIVEEVRRLSPPAPPHDWSQLLGAIDAVAWRAAVAPTRTRSGPLSSRSWTPGPGSRSPARAAAGGRGGCRDRGSWTTCARTGRPSPPPVYGTGARSSGSWRPSRRTRTATPSRAWPPRCGTCAWSGTTRGGCGPWWPPWTRTGRSGAGVGGRALRRTDGCAAVRGPARRRRSRRPGRPGRAQDPGAQAPYKATPLAAETYERLWTRLGGAGRRTVLAAALPEDPAELWRPGGVVAAVERMAGAWRELLGALPPSTTRRPTPWRPTSVSEVWARRLAGATTPPRTTPCPRPAGSWRRPAGHGVEVRAIPQAGPELPYRTPVGLALTDVASALVWAWTDRPVGDPSLSGAPELYERLRAELDRPELLLELPEGRVRDTPERIAERFGPRRLPVARHRRTRRAGERLRLRTAGGVRPHGTAFLRPAAVTDPGTWREVREVTDLAEDLDRLAPLLAGGGLERMMRRALSGAVPAGGYEADPRLSCPELVARVAAELGTGGDAAALYLQLAALAAPTDRNVRRWNGWSTRRHAEVRAELLATGAVLEAKRARAGRTLFLPGDWTGLKAPHLPLETAKLTTHLVRPLWDKWIRSPFVRVLPTAPLHEMFEEAWRRTLG